MCMSVDISLAEHAFLFPGVCNVAPGAAPVVRQSSRLLLQSDFLKAEGGTRVLAAALSAWPALKCHHHQRKRALKWVLVLSASFPFTTLWKPHSLQPDKKSRWRPNSCLQYSPHSVLVPKLSPFPSSTLPSPLSFSLLLTHSLIFPSPAPSAQEIFVKAFFKNDYSWINVVTKFLDKVTSACVVCIVSIAFQHQLNYMSYLLQSASLLWLMLLW